MHPITLARFVWTSILLAAAAAAVCVGQSTPPLILPHVFGDHMVLQSDQPVPVWGWAAAGQKVTVSFANQRKQTVAAADGAWKVVLDPMKPSSNPATLTVTGSESKTFEDVLVGAVWLCSGQSNMQKPVGTWRGQPVPTDNFEQELAQADFPQIRLLNTEIAESATPARDLKITTGPTPDYPWLGWVRTSPASLDHVKFSAACYFFGRKLHRDLNIPVGLIEASAGGTHIEAWMSAAALASDPALADWARAAETPMVAFQGTRITTLYNGMIHPLIPFAMRGVLWYQGESNVYNQDGAIYAHKQEALIKSWRADWGRELSFYFVQLPPLLYSVTRPQYVHSPGVEPGFWEAQASTLRLPRTGMAVTIDVGDPTNIHPPHKKEVGERLALIAEAKDYGRKIEDSGPAFRSMEIKGNTAVLHFDHVGGGLASSDGKPLSWWTVAGPDGVFKPAEAVIRGDSVIVSSAEVAAPSAVRFAWSEAAAPNFINQAGLPAGPFRTDRF